MDDAAVELSAIPAAGPLYRRAVIGLAPGFRPGRRADRLPEAELVVRGVTVDRDHLTGYDRVCGFRLSDALPPTYPHVLAFPLALRLMSAPEFPLPLVGLVHVANRITVHRRIDAAEPLDLSVRAVDLRPHERGRQFDVLCTASVGGEVVWGGVSTYLWRKRGGAEAARRDAGDQPRSPAPTALWRVDARVGRDYARVSGDRNPIHTSRVAARLFGFPGPIAHGMWSKARCLAALEGRLPDAYEVEVAFKLPLPLPGTVAFTATRATDGPATATRATDTATTDTATTDRPATATRATDTATTDRPATDGPPAAATGTPAGRSAAWSFGLREAQRGRPYLVGGITSISD